MAQIPAVQDSYVGDGVTRIFDIHFVYLSKAEVFVNVDGVSVPFTWLAGSGSSVQLAVAPAPTATIRIYRSTLANDLLHAFDGGVPFLPRYVDENNRQLLYVSQEAVSTSTAAMTIANEVRDRIDDAEVVAAEAKALSEAANATSVQAGTDAANALLVATDASTTANGIAGVADAAAADAAEALELAEEAIDLVSGAGVATFNGRSGAVVPASGDYTADMVPYAATTVKLALDAHLGKRGTAQHPVASATEAGFLPPFPSLSDGKVYGFRNGSFYEMSTGVFGTPTMLASRNGSNVGIPFADGQLINNALALYPAAVADVRSANPTVPVTTPALWLSDPTLRACWAYDVANDQLRVPDYNGKSAGSLGPLMFRGDGTLGFAPGKIRQDQSQGYRVEMAAAFVSDTRPIGGGLAGTNYGNTTQGAEQIGPTVAWGSSTGTGNANGYPVFNSGRRMTDGTNGTPRTGTETFPTHAVIIWGVVLFGTVGNAGAADAGALATSYANQQAAITAMQTKGRRTVVSYDVAGSGGTQTLGAWRVRPISGVTAGTANSLNSTVQDNGVVVPPGRYKFTLNLAAYSISNFRVRIYDAVSATTKWVSVNSANLGTGSLSNVMGSFNGEFTVNSSAYLTVEVYSTATNANGMGLVSGISDSAVPTERYLQLELETI